MSETGQSASAFVPTRTGAVFASGDQVDDLVDGGTAVAIGTVPEHAVFLQVDPTLRYVAWEARRADGLHARVLVYDGVAHRVVLDRVLLWGGRTSPLRITTFGAARAPAGTPAAVGFLDLRHVVGSGPGDAGRTSC
jgi:hypothetical protein